MTAPTVATNTLYRLNPVTPLAPSTLKILPPSTAPTLALVQSGSPVDIVAAASWLRDRGCLGRVGGAAYVAQLADATPGAPLEVTEDAAHVEQEPNARTFSGIVSSTPSRSGSS
jgi:hypothetical protein